MLSEGFYLLLFFGAREEGETRPSQGGEKIKRRYLGGGEEKRTTG